MKTLEELVEGDVVSIRSGYNHANEIATGNVTRVTNMFITAATPYYARPVRFRRAGRMQGIHVIGGLAEWLNDRIVPAE